LRGFSENSYGNDYIWENFIELIYESFTHYHRRSVPDTGISLLAAEEQCSGRRQCRHREYHVTTKHQGVQTLQRGTRHNEDNT
jgi:hypothetical protein